MDEYLERAEKLKDHLEKASERKSKDATIGAGGSATAKKGSGDDDDADVKKLRAGLSSKYGSPGVFNC